MEQNKIIIGEFRKEFCNDHQKPIRFLRSVFYDEQDGAEQIEKFIIKALSQQREEIAEMIKKKNTRNVDCPENCENEEIYYEGYFNALATLLTNLTKE